jgi:uncharacterized protein (DUF1800 family)
MSVEQYAPAIACNRFGLGARPGELAAAALGPRDWLRSQLRGGAPTLQDGLSLPGLAPLQSSAQILAGAIPIAQALRAARQRTASAGAAAEATPADAVVATLQRLPHYFRPLYQREVRARTYAAAVSTRPLLERLVYFWSNHFAVSVDKLAVLGVAGSLEREAIRPHVLGRFEDLLLAVERHPAMLLYLDNQQSTGPDAPLARRAAARGRERGLNENLAREILELHTLGVDGGYSQADVTSFARVLTGWSVGAARNLFSGEAPGEFRFRPLLHEPGAQSLLGRRYAESGSAQGEQVLRDLAHSSATARHVAVKLARHFIADEPPASAVARIAHAFERSDGDLPTVYTALIEADESWQSCFVKYKTPLDYLSSTYRALGAPLTASLADEQDARPLAAYELLGQRTFAPGSPAGWPDRSSDWDGAGALLKRIELAERLGQRLGGTVDAAALARELWGAALSVETQHALAQAASGAQALTLLLTAPEFMRR